MPSRYVICKDFKEACEADAAGVLYIDNEGDYKDDPDYEPEWLSAKVWWAADCWRNYYGNRWPVEDFAMLVED